MPRAELATVRKIREPEPKRESALYLPVKRFFEARGLDVKGEIGGCDLVAVSQGDPPIVVIGELKLRFSLELVLQATDRLAAGDEVWLVAQGAKREIGREHDRRFRQLCRRLGIGMLIVDARGDVAVIVSPDAALPRRDPKRKARLLKEHNKRLGDPVAGGSTGKPIMTAYRQQALACASLIAHHGPLRARDISQDHPDASKLFQRNVYGWFYRVERGRYGLTEGGRTALELWQPSLFTKASDAG